MDFMNHKEKTFRVNKNNDVGTVLLLPYEDEKYNFFYLMRNESSTLEQMRNDLTADKLMNILKNAVNSFADISVPKFKVESELDGVELLTKLGVKKVFEDGADLSKISSTPLKVGKIQHNAVIEVDEAGTEAAAASTVVEYEIEMGFDGEVERIIIDRPFLYGIIRDDEDVIFLG
ncbi:hypothetical protein PENTCL1PPCAC_2851, partial [Pristionchus entomophagus]